MVPHVSEIFVIYEHNVTVWARHVVAIVIIINHEVFTDFVECRCGDVGREIIGKRDIDRKGLF